MTTLCITGHHPLSLTLIAAQLGQAGMAAPQPLQRDSNVTLQVWHQRVCAQATGALQPSRLWEQLAVDLMLANLDAPVWGWAATQSHQLLDFWAQLDDDIRFVLVCQTPKQAITHLLTGVSAHASGTTATAQALADWHSHHQALLRFHLRHPGQSVMVWANQAQTVPEALVAQLNQCWNLALTETSSLRGGATRQSTHADGTPNAVIQQLVSHIANLHPELDELDRELHATVTQLIEPSDPAQDQEAGQGEATAPAPSIEALIDSYHRLTDRSAEQAALQAQTDANIHALAQRDAEASAKTDALTQCDQEAKAKTTAQAQLKESQQEGDLLLLQLHQVQEELEKHFLQNQDTATQLAALKSKFDAEIKAKAEALAQRDALNGEKAKLTADNASLSKTSADSKTAHAEETKSRVAAVTQRDTEIKEKTTAQAQLKESQQEGELLLLQLHQVQEELEKYYLQHQQAQRDVQTHSDRWNRLLKTQPDLSDFDAVELLTDGGEGQPLHWRLNNASLAGRSFSQLDFSMVIEEGVAGFVVRRTANGASPLLRWPASAKTESELTIIPVNGGASAQRRAAHLVQLCASDWGLMLALPNLLTQALQRGHLALTPARQQTLLKALGRFKHIMESMQGLVRFDRVSLTGQQSAGQRNVLAIKLDQTRFAKHSLASFAFQLQINKNAAGQPEAAHFIFDEKTASAPFQAWVSNMPSTAGHPVMAVRLDARGWVETAQPQLSPDDQSFMSALTDSLAVILITLQADGTRATYPWQDWLKDATLLRQWSRQPRLPVAPILLPEPSQAPELPQAPEPTLATLPAPPTLLALAVKPVRKPRVAKDKAAAPVATPAPTAKPAPKARRTKGVVN
jgi:hypothetical protein